MDIRRIANSESGDVDGVQDYAIEENSNLKNIVI